MALFHRWFSVLLMTIVFIMPVWADIPRSNDGIKVKFISSNPITFTELIQQPWPHYQPIWGYLSWPKTKTKQKVPAVVMIPGSSGIQAWNAKYIKGLNELGIATLLVDDYHPRGLQTSVNDQASLPVPMVVADAYAAIKFLAKQPGIDSKHIAIMGWSLGGLISILTAFEDLNKPVLGQKLRYAAHMAFYPPCNLDFPNTHLDGAPWLYLHGGKDDYTRSSTCLMLLDKLRHLAQLHTVVYPDAYHGFDGATSLQWFPNVQNPSLCRGKFNKDWQVTEEKTGIVLRTRADFRRAYSGCMTRGAHVGYNAIASHDALIEVNEFAKYYLIKSS